ncbi:DUF2330 domain-containing protein [Nannocystaceae bacterium ST9]
MPAPLRTPAAPPIPVAPSEEAWRAMSQAERDRFVDAVNDALSDPARTMEEGRPHVRAKNRVVDMLSLHFEAMGRVIYVADDMAAIYPGEECISPDVLIVLDVEQPEDDERMAWVVADEGRGLDLALEVLHKGDRKKDLVDNVTRYARLGISEYFIYDWGKQQLYGYRLELPEARRYQRIVPQSGRYHSTVLGLDLVLQGGSLRFYHGMGELIGSDELIDRLTDMVDSLEAKAEQAEAAFEQAEAKAVRAEASAELAKARLDEALASSRENVLAFLAARRLACTDEIRDRVLTCDDFAMVVPVPVVLQEGDVKTLERSVFDRVDQLAAPRLVEYWEQDPCEIERYPRERWRNRRTMKSAEMVPSAMESGGDYKVTIEAEFTVAEYDIVILSAEDASGLDRWLQDSGYAIPPGAEPLLRPYVQQGMKFFVAKVDAQKVAFDEQGQAMLSPLRFHYDSEDFVLPVRLGLINAKGAQDLLIHILARNQRYELANYENVTIPTNLEVKDETREHFGQFYASLFDHTLEQRPKAVVTEYAWAAASCDPCPVEPLSSQELRVLGADALPELKHYFDEQGNMLPEAEYSMAYEFTITRLHARYDKASLGEDLVFRTAPPIVGGREFLQTDGKLERGAVPAEYGTDNFQARYIIRHYWEGAVACANPEFGKWGGPPGGGSSTEVARDLAFVPRGAKLEKFVTASAHEELGLASPAPASNVTYAAKRERSFERQASGEGDGCAHCSIDDQRWGLGAVASLGMLGLLGLGLRRRDRSRA